MTTEAPRRVVKFAHTSRGESISSDAVILGQPLTREWAWGGSTGRNVRVCVIDSGVDADHPAVGGRIECYRVATPDGEGQHAIIEPDDQGDVAGHGTACAGIIRGLAPDCEIVSVRVLGDNLRGNGGALVTALEWAIEQRVDVINLSLSTRKPALKERLHDAVERAYFSGVTVVSSAHNSPVQSYPWRFSSVLSVGSHDRQDPEYLEVSPDPPVEFFASGVNISAAWLDGRTAQVSGNSFAAPHVTGLCARILELHPTFRAAQLKQVLASVANNVEVRRG
jgi:subtilisin family serine protease